MGQVNLDGGMGYTSVDRQFRPRFNVDTRGGGLYGYSPGYTNIGMFMPFAIEQDEAILFLDARGVVTHDGGGGANAGAGWRWWMEDVDRIVGLSAWYDFDSGHRSSYSQIGLSFESLGRFVDYRVNGYIPIGTQSYMINSSVDPTDISFGVNDILFRRTNIAEQTYTGFDAEVGGPVPVLGRYGVNAYAGGYHFLGNGGRGGSFTGVSGRFMAQINEDVSFGVQVTDDHQFGTNTQFQVFVTLPDGAPSRWLRNPRVQDRLTESVYRQYRVMASTDTYSTFDQAINPRDGLPYFVTHIDPNLTAPGNGTLENPFNSIAVYNGQSVPAQQQSDIIYVRPRTDGSNTNLDTAPTFTLYDSQRLLSTSVAHTFTSTNFPNIVHTLPVPTGFANGDPLPMLFNSTGGDVVTFAPGNIRCIEVSGFDLTGSATGSGIVGTDNQMVLINRNNIHDGLFGVRLTDLHGTGGAASEIIDNNFHDNIIDGFHVTNTGAPPLEIIVLGNTFFNNGDDGMQLDANAGSIIGGVIGLADIPASDGPPPTPAVVRSNTFDSNVTSGLHLTADGGTLDFQTVTATTDYGISNNGFYRQAGTGLLVDSTNNSTVLLNIFANRFGGDPLTP
ncbi:MAG: right-handed parallel beta-helix repeat-containing protein, partial [Candidatus Saccharimonas sp.]|nr:right-handed parallel beta-helix repeat-containing protein [Planctomycetaceae bacterium]